MDLQVCRGEVLGLIGPNGSGKTTLLRILFGALRPREGTVTFDGRPLTRLSPRQIAQRIAVVIQEPRSELMLSAADMVILGRTPHLGMFSRRGPRDDELAAAALEKVGALDLAHRDISELSGGEKQRVLIARALVQEADCLLLDEPTNHLDIGYQHQVLDLVRGLEMTAVVVLHDLNLAARYCDRLMLLDRGRVRASGDVPQVLRSETIERVYGVATERATAYDEVPQLLFHRYQGPADEV
ncbi:ABC transporter ATP-binding protein [Nocardiopsis sp. NPDC006832]|uniref:ABC transporter ATP-binding protein n=1 Tax=Nocardiopsis sp. NPDC006832 TaxID=3157188 RepID=UPI003407CFF3